MTTDSPIADLATNSLLTPWTGPFGLAPFSHIKPEHFLPALREGMRQHKAEIDAIATNPEPVTFENTILAMEQAGRLFSRVNLAFHALTGSDTNDALDAIEREIGPEESAHDDAITFNEALFKRIDTVFEARENLDAQAKRLVEKIHRGFVESGAKLPAETKKRVSAINTRLTELTTQFKQNNVADTNAYQLVLEDGDDLAGLPQSFLDASAAAAEQRGHPGKHVVTLNASSRVGFLTYAQRRELREALFRASKNRGDQDNEFDNKAIILEKVRLRAELARHMGYDTYSAYTTSDRMAKNPANVHKLLDELWSYSRPALIAEKAELEELAHSLGHNGELEEWDVYYYANILRERECAFNEEEAKQYFTLDKTIAAAFDTASRLFGLQFREVTDFDHYHPDVRAWEVLDAAGQHRALFLGDYFSRPSKKSGAWMWHLRSSDRTMPEGEQSPIVYNVCNFNKPAPGKSCLLTLDDVRTTFHEFGHALHDMLSQVDYPSLAGTSVKWDFVELPSQLFEHWSMTDEILGDFAHHHETGAAMPQELRHKIRKAEKFRQGYFVSGILSGSMLDMAWHDQTEDANVTDVHAFEQQLAAKIELPKILAYRPPSASFSHIFSGGYAAAYYSYLWSMVLDSDAFQAFVETGDAFNPEVGKRLHDYVYSAGDSQDPAELYRKFRGRDATVMPLLQDFGFLPESSQPSPSQKAQPDAPTL